MFMIQKRKVWFITRPQRDPTFHAAALKALDVATNHFSLKWGGNRAIQKQYEQELINAGLKRAHISTQGSGGRTWAAMLQTFDYFYESQDGFLHLTKVGKALIDGIKVRENTIKQLLTLQIPNAYFSKDSSGPQFEDDFAIRPIRFLVKVANSSEIDYSVSIDEIVYCVMRTHKDSLLGECLTRILIYRSMPEAQKAQYRDDLDAQDDHRERIDKDARGFRATNYDVATTFMLMAKYTGAVEYDNSKNGHSSMLLVPMGIRTATTELLKSFDRRYPYNTRYKFSTVAMAENNGLDVDSYKANYSEGIEQATTMKKLITLATPIVANDPLVDKTNRESIGEALSKSGIFTEAQIATLTEYLFKMNLPIFGDEFIDDYLNETDDRMFEDQTASLLELLGLTVFLRPKPLRGNGPNIEIAVLDKSGRFGIIDCKCYGESFALTSSFADYMGSEYIPDYEGYKGNKVSFFGYIVLKKFTGESKLPKVTEQAKLHLNGREIKGFIITAKSLLELVSYYVDQSTDEEKSHFDFSLLATNKGYGGFQEIKDVLFSK